MTRDHDREDAPSSPTRSSEPHREDARPEDRTARADDEPAGDAVPPRLDPVRSPERGRIQALAKTYREQFRHRHVDDD